MLEQWIERAVKIIAVADQIITAGGPFLTFVLAMLFGVAAAQALKFLYKGDLREPWDSRLTQVIAIAAAVFFAHCLSKSLNWGWKIAAGFSSIGFYHVTLMAIRKWVPWLEVSPLVGACHPPASAEQAAVQRQIEKIGGNNGS